MKDIKLRDYQSETINSLYTWFKNNKYGNPMLILPTGAGKSIILASIIKNILIRWPQQRILMLTHVKELIQQNAEKLKLLWPQAPLGIYSSGLGRKDRFEPIIFAGIQSAAKKAMQLGLFNLIFVDECHLINHNEEGQYRKFLDQSSSINSKVRIIGLTATPFRTGYGSIMHGEKPLFHDIAHEVKIIDLIEAGYLSRPISKKVATEIDVTGVRIQNGDFLQKDLQTVADRESITESAIEEIKLFGENRKGWLIFCSGVNHAEHFAEALNKSGIKAGCITGKTKKAQRDLTISLFKRGDIRALTNANVLTTGFDAPHIDLLALLRPTQSPGLYVQMIGRGMRVTENKENCLILDFSGNALRHGPIDKIQAWTPGQRNGQGGEAPTKKCPSCGSARPTSARICTQCGYEFEIQTIKHDAKASNEPILSTELKLDQKTIAITNCIYRRHEVAGKIPSLRVDYYNGLFRAASEFICLEHSGYPRAKAAMWWTERAKIPSIPETVNDALNMKPEKVLSIPSKITVIKRGRYYEITDYIF